MLEVRIKKGKNFSGGQSAFIKFDYNAELLKQLKSLNSKYYHSDIRMWEIPVRFLNLFLKKIKTTDIKLIEEKPEKIDFPKEWKYKTKEILQHQLEGIQYGLSHDRFHLGDEQGLGKTMQALHIASIKKITRNYKHCLIVCGINGAKYNWYDEVFKHTYENAHILGFRTNSKGKYVIDKKGANNAKLDDLNRIGELPYFIITNVETLRGGLSSKKGKKLAARPVQEQIITKLKDLCDSAEIEMIIFDEIHECSNPASQQGFGLLQLNTETKITLSGTPLLNYPLDLYMPMHWLGFEMHSYGAFKGMYCTMGQFNRIIGFRNIGELKLRWKNIQLRRLKKDCLDLPNKIYKDEYLEMTENQEKIYKEIMNSYLQEVDKIKLQPNPLVSLIRLRQATGFTGILSTAIRESVKFDRAFDILDNAIKNDRKCLIFSNWTDCINPLYNAMKNEGYNPALLTGELSESRCEEEKKRFQNDDSCKVLLGTTKKMGTAHTLTSGSVVIFLDEPWNRGRKEQAEDRAHRIGTVKDVYVITLICKNTIDERINDLVKTKGEWFDMIVAGMPIKNKQEIIDYLLT